MRKTFLASAMALATTTALPALDLSVHGGYTNFNLAGLNRGNANLIGYESNPYSQPIDSGAVVGADLLASAGNGLQVGLRTEYMQSNLAETKSGVYGFPGDTTPDTCFTDQAALSTLLVGVRANSGPVLKGLTLGLGAWAGYGYATLDQRQTLSDSFYVQSGLFMGTMPVAELESSVNYSLGHGLSLSFLGGWRWANAGLLYDGTHHALADTGQYVINGDDRGIDLDYSGITGQGSVSYSF